MIKLSRFERKLLFALVTVAVLPMLGALSLGYGALRESYQVGVNEWVRGELDRCLSLYRTHFNAMRTHAASQVLAISNDHGLYVALERGNRAGVQGRLDALLDLHGDVAAVEIRDAAGEIVGKAQRAVAPQSGEQRELQLSEQIDVRAQTYVLDGTVHAPADVFQQYMRAGELVDVYTRLERGKGTVSNYYLLVYMAFLVGVIGLAVAIGVVLSRRVTRRVAVLASATARVGAGDLTVQVPTSDQDEVAELTRAFNRMVRDIHESRERIEYLQRLGAWQEFARRLAHEIKNPLTPIQLAVQEIHRSYKGEDEAFKSRLDDAAGIVFEEVATLRRLVSEFGDFARLPQAMLEQADLNEFLADARRSLLGIGAAYPLETGEPAGELICEPGSVPLPVQIDRMMLQRCVDNLVRNAFQAIRDGGTSGIVRVSTAKAGNSALLVVTDDGPGVPEQQRERIFDPYVTTKSDGTGLGLAIVKKVVFEHGGEIRCDPVQPHGARFTIRIPIAD